MSESGDFDPGPWAGHDFKSAYQRYDSHVGRSYADAAADSKPALDLIEKSIKTNCTNPLVIWSDVTGSMGEWPKVMFSKLPYLELEAKEYLGKDLEIAFGAIGDANKNDKYPLQIRPFTKGTALKTRMEELVIEGGGGGGGDETYELAGLYSLHNISMPNAVKPILIIIGDEKPYDTISTEMAEKVALVKLEKRASTSEVFERLKDKFSVYLIRKPYNAVAGDAMSDEDKEFRKRWIALLGADHVVELPDAKRVVDVIFGILARETGRIEYFREEIEGRQDADQVKTVYKSLATIHKLPAAGKPVDRGNSILKLPEGKAKGDVSRKLLK